MKKLLFLILIGIGLTGTAQAIRFDWVLGQPAEILDNTPSTTSDAVWWVLGQPSVVASTTIQGVVPTPIIRNRIIIISENFQMVKNKKV